MKEKGKTNSIESYIEVTRKLLHLIPSQSPQGSELAQLGGVFSQISLIDCKPRTACKWIPKQKHPNN